MAAPSLFYLYSAREKERREEEEGGEGREGRKEREISLSICCYFPTIKSAT
jgi:hypothetical protein